MTGRHFVTVVAAQQGPVYKVEPNEWWHYNYRDWRLYPILDIPFTAIE